ncbi:unnamed protein product [Sphenostylis stenocarpa]|uniref:Cation/H+ exchanger transmembrane domain-containing protein n=1 Tax=Sphenostylis stenocarpa TaxID=92480 RepID=A0AA86TG36_9FABA|nr:unnamed protein product [Sphenostylis stenocarpa]
MALLLPPLHFSTSYLSTSTIVALCVFFTLLGACVIIGHLLEENRWANESIIALLLGLCAGTVVLFVTNFQSAKILIFSEDLFFLYLLPPIIFNAGFQVKKKQFFKNFTTILLFGVIGTVISFCLISVGALMLIQWIGIANLGIKDYLAIGAILSATDSVCTLQVLNQDETPLLYSIVFGEGVVNDATSIVLFNSVQSLDFTSNNSMTALKLLGTFLYLFCTSTALGVGVGLLSAYIIKALYLGRHSTDRELALMMLLAYLSYMIAELFTLEIQDIYTDICVASAAFESQWDFDYFLLWHCYVTLHLAQCYIKLKDNHQTLTNGKAAKAGTSVAVSSALFALVLIGRAAFVQVPDIRFNFAVAKRTSTQDSAFMITSTIIVVLFSTVVFGSITKPLIEAVQLRHSKPTSFDSTDNVEDLRFLLLENTGPLNQNNNRPFQRQSRIGTLMSHPSKTVHYFWRKFDDKFMRPVFGGRGFVPFAPVEE